MKRLLLLIPAIALAQTPLDPTMAGAYPVHSSDPTVPDYIDQACGSLSPAPPPYDLVINADSTVTAAFRFVTTCPGSGRGAKPTIYMTCWAVTFAADQYSVTARDELLATHWKFGQQAVLCPAL